MLRWIFLRTSEPVAGFFERRFGWSRFRLIARVEQVKGTLDFLVILGGVTALAVLDASSMSKELYVAAMVANFCFFAWRLAVAQEMRAIDRGRSVRPSAAAVMFHHWRIRTWNDISLALYIPFGLALVLWACIGVVSGAPWLAALGLLALAYFIVSILCDALWMHAAVQHAIPSLFADV